MQRFTKAEIEWIIGELDRAAVHLKRQAIKEESAGLAAGFINLRSEQFASVADKLQKVIANGDKRIEVTY